MLVPTPPRPIGRPRRRDLGCGVLLAVVAAALACGCARGPTLEIPSEATGETPPTLRREVTLDTGLIVLELTVPLDPAGPKPTVIAPVGFPLPVVEAGAVAVWYRIDWSRLAGAPSLDLPENAGAGQPPLAAPSPDTLGEPFFHRVAIAADAVVPRILDWLETLPEVDLERIALVGAAEDGLVALAAAVRDTRIAAVAAPFACGDWTAVLRDSSRGMAGAPLSLDAGYAAWLFHESPDAALARLVPAPVLLASREDDPLVPASCVEGSARALEAPYGAAGVPERATVLRLPPGDDGRAAILAWLERWVFDRQADE